MKDPAQFDLLTDNILLLMVGHLVAFLVAMIAIRFFINFLTKYGFRAFGFYRIIVGGILLILIGAGVNVSM